MTTLNAEEHLAYEILQEVEYEDTIMPYRGIPKIVRLLAKHRQFLEEQWSWTEGMPTKDGRYEVELEMQLENLPRPANARSIKLLIENGEPYLEGPYLHGPLYEWIPKETIKSAKHRVRP